MVVKHGDESHGRIHKTSPETNKKRFKGSLSNFGIILGGCYNSCWEVSWNDFCGEN